MHFLKIGSPLNNPNYDPNHNILCNDISYINMNSNNLTTNK